MNHFRVWRAVCIAFRPSRFRLSAFRSYNHTLPLHAAPYKGLSLHPDGPPVRFTSAPASNSAVTTSACAS
eukprot:9480226-Pyramimonas_sp.AAC.2